ncbi:kinase-like domain-containing protein [Mycena latifolia]|nr:kinase-like domain-containing protein [Mycena latifolia]
MLISSQRLQRESQIWMRLKHRNIVPFIGMCDDIAPLPLIVLPLYEAGHVGMYLRQHPETNRPELLRGIVSGVEYLHANDIVHGDIKPQNILVDGGVPCITDFGISRIIGQRGFTTSSVGVPSYMAPELFFVLDGKAQEEAVNITITKSSDVYSFALVVLEILTSEPNKGRPSKPIVTANILANLHPKRADYDNKAINHIWPVLEPCWAFDPGLRPTIVEVRQGLSSAFSTLVV